MTRPVHNFLLRHVYHSSISFMKVDRYTATLITFFLSACIHELIMWCLFKKLRGYLLILQMCQLPVCGPFASSLLTPLPSHILSVSPRCPLPYRLYIHHNRNCQPFSFSYENHGRTWADPPQLVRLSRTRFLRDRKVFGNVIFWIGLFTGPSVLCSLYLIL